MGVENFLDHASTTISSRNVISSLNGLATGIVKHGGSLNSGERGRSLNYRTPAEVLNDLPNAVPTRLIADAGYDSEKNHELLREYLGIDSLIPPGVGRPTEKLPAGKWRCLMATAFDDEAYGQRWQAETVIRRGGCSSDTRARPSPPARTKPAAARWA